MLQFSIVLFFKLLLTISWYQEVYTVNYLPLILIQREIEIDFVYPNELKTIVFEKDRGFIGATKFTWNKYERQLFFCPPDEKQEKEYIRGSDFLHKLRHYYKNYTVAGHCLFAKKFKPSDDLTCAEKPTPSIYKAQVGWQLDENNEIELTKYDVRCGPQNKGVLFKFAYDLCIPIPLLPRVRSFFNFKNTLKQRVFTAKMKFFYVAQTVYEICFNMEDRAKEETIYTKHELSSIRLLNDPNLKYERDREKEDDTISDETYNQNFKFKKYIEFLDKLPQQYKKQKLVSPDDRMTALLRKPTFHYINIKPMHEAVIELWNYIEKYLRENLPETEIPYQIYTGAFKISEESKETKIPDFWVKVIHLPSKRQQDSQSLAIVLRNDYKENEEYDNSKMEDFCMEDSCQFLKKDESFDKFLHLSSHLRCCAVGSKISNLFNIYINQGVLLPLVKLRNENAGKIASEGR